MLNAIMAAVPALFSSEFLKKEQIAQGTFSFYFAKNDLDFLPGQFIRMQLPHANADERGASRYFSLSSSPTESAYFTITTKIIQSTFKKTLFSLLPRTSVQFFGPSGNFILDATKKQQHICIAGGIGITPFHSMLRFTYAKKLSIPMILFVSFSTIEEAAFYEELITIAKEMENVQIIYTITHPSASTWHGETGRISAAMLQKYGIAQDALLFIAGPPAMNQAMEQIVLDMGFRKEQIRRENFVGY